MNKSQKREALVLEYLQRAGKLTIKELSEKLGVSEPTARRISSSLAEKNKVVRTHGGIRYLPSSEFEYSFDTLENKFINEKRRIAHYASHLIEDNDIIFLEAGTTVQHLALAIADRLRNNDLNNIMVFTNSLNNLNILSSICKVTLIGGEYRPERRDFSGYISEKVLKFLNFKTCFLGADAIDIHNGIMASDVDTVRFDELLITKSEKAIILADSSKFNLRSCVSYASVNEVSMIITDKKLSSATLHQFQSNALDVVCV